MAVVLREDGSPVEPRVLPRLTLHPNTVAPGPVTWLSQRSSGAAFSFGRGPFARLWGNSAQSSPRLVLVMLLVWFAYVGSVAAAGVVVWGLLAYYSRSRDCVPILVSWVAVTSALSITLLLPVDVYIVSNTLSATVCSEGQPNEKLGDIQSQISAVQYLAFALWGASAALAFLVIPFCYFYYEEEETFGFEMPRRGTRTCKGLKYTVFLVLVLGALVGVDLIFKPGRALDDLSPVSMARRDNWQRPLGPRAVQVFNMLLVATGCVGLLGWVAYTSVGLTSIPIHLLKRLGHVDTLQATIAERERLLGDRYYQIREKSRRHGFDSLSRRERRDAEISEHNRAVLNGERARLERDQPCISHMLDMCPLLRLVLGILLLILCVFVLESAIVSMLDSAFNNVGVNKVGGLRYGLVEQCGVSNCWGERYNLLSTLLRGTGCANGLDCADEATRTATSSQLTVLGTIATFIVVGLIAVFLLISTYYGMAIVGMPLGLRIKPHRTWPQSLLVGSFVSVAILWGVSLVFPTLAPQFFYFGCQQEVTTGRTWCSDGAIDTEIVLPYYCIRTQLSRTSSFVRMSLPPVGIYMFVINWVRALMQSHAVYVG